MTIKELLEIIEGAPLTGFDENQEFTYAFASDLMSDALALVNEYCEETVLITGLCNAQSIRTADMLDVRTIVYVRNKQVNDELLTLAKEMDVVLITTNLTMFETCGRLYQHDIQSVGSYGSLS